MKEYTVKVYENKTEWYRNGKLDRDLGPAVEYVSGSKRWFREGELHRTDGPAEEIINWYLEGIQYTEEQYRKKMNLKPSCEGTVVEIDGKRYRLAVM